MYNNVYVYREANMYTHIICIHSSISFVVIPPPLLALVLFLFGCVVFVFFCLCFFCFCGSICWQVVRVLLLFVFFASAGGAAVGLPLAESAAAPSQLACCVAELIFSPCG